MTTLQTFENTLTSFESYNVKSFPPLIPDNTDRGRSIDIYIKNRTMYFTKRNTPKSVKFDKLIEAFNLFLHKERMSRDEPELIQIISEGCIRTFFFQLIRHFNFAKIEGTGKSGDKCFAVLL